MRQGPQYACSLRLKLPPKAYSALMTLLCRRLGLGAHNLLEEYTRIRGSQAGLLLGACLQSQQADSSPESQKAAAKQLPAVKQLLSQAEAEISSLLNKRSTALPAR